MAFGAGRVATLEATSVTVTKELASASIRSPIIQATSFLRSATTTYANLSNADPSPTIGDQLVISDASACTINTAVTSGGGTAHACPVVYTGSWVALVSH